MSYSDIFESVICLANSWQGITEVVLPNLGTSVQYAVYVDYVGVQVNSEGMIFPFLSFEF